MANFLELTKEEQLKYLKNKNLALFVENGEVYDTEGDLSDVIIKTKDKKIYIICKLDKNDFFNQTTFIIYDSKLSPIGKCSFYHNDYKKYSFNYLYIKKEERKKGFGRFLANIFKEFAFQNYSNPEIYVVPLVFETVGKSTRLIKAEQIKLEGFYLSLDFRLTKQPKEHVFGDLKYKKNEYNLTTF